MEFLKVRAIITIDDKLAVNHVNIEGKKYFIFPGGIKEKFESDEDFIIKKIKKDFGIDVAPIKKLYYYENNNYIENFYVCVWITGNFKERKSYEVNQNIFFGEYKPTFIDIKNIPTLPLMPKEVANKFYLDYKEKNFDFINTKVIPGCLAK